MNIKETVNISPININFALQMDKNTDINGKAQLMRCIQFIYDSKTSNQFLFCKHIWNTKGQDVYETLNFCIIQSNMS